MKTQHPIRALLALCLLVFCTGAAGGGFGLGWEDPNPPEKKVTHYRIYAEAGPGLELLAQTSETSVRLDVPREGMTIVATAVNNQGRESDPSEPFVILPIPLAPEGLRVKITIDLETSSNLTDWQNVASISWPADAAPKQFFRLRD